MQIVINFLLAIYVLVALLMILVILMQRPKSEGLGAAFGGAMTENLFGAQTTNVLVKCTGWLAGIFFAITFTLSVLYAHRSMGGSSLSRELKKGAPAAAVSPAPATSPAAKSSTAASPASSAGMGFVPAGSAAPGNSPTGANTAPATSVAPQTNASVSPAASQPKP